MESNGKQFAEESGLRRLLSSLDRVKRLLHTDAIKERSGTDRVAVHVARGADLAGDVALQERKCWLRGKVGTPLEEVNAIGNTGPGDGSSGRDPARCLE